LVRHAGPIFWREFHTRLMRVKVRRQDVVCINMNGFGTRCLPVYFCPPATGPSRRTGRPMPDRFRKSARGASPLAGLLQCGASYSNGPPSVCLSVTREYPKLSEIDIWLLRNSNRNPGFPIQNLPSDSRSEVRFRHFGSSRVGTSPI